MKRTPILGEVLHAVTKYMCHLNLPTNNDDKLDNSVESADISGGTTYILKVRSSRSRLPTQLFVDLYLK